MIGYRVGPRELQRRIREQDPNWLAQAESGEEPPWSRIKHVFISVQHFKCGYCERLMPHPQRHAGADAVGQTWGGRREYDLEHFRPKRQVTRWPTTASGLQYEFETGVELTRGYPWLAYDCLNYLVSCKTCNQDNKKTCFPISGPRNRRQQCASTEPVRTPLPRQSGRHGRRVTGGTDRPPGFRGGAPRFPRTPAQAGEGHHRSLRPEPASRADSRTLQPDQGDVALPGTPPHG